MSKQSNSIKHKIILVHSKRSLHILNLVSDSHNYRVYIFVLQELENSASSDAAIREKIANLPADVSDINLLARLEGKKTANMCR